MEDNYRASCSCSECDCCSGHDIECSKSTIDKTSELYEVLKDIQENASSHPKIVVTSWSIGMSPKGGDAYSLERLRTSAWNQLTEQVLGNRVIYINDYVIDWMTEGVLWGDVHCWRWFRENYPASKVYFFWRRQLGSPLKN